MGFVNVKVEARDDHVGVITLNRPDHLNSFDMGLATDLLEALKMMENDPNVRVVMITGAGRVFCAGIDLKGFEGKTEAQYQEWIHLMESPLVFMGEMAKPVIAKVNGHAAANGAGVVAAADIAIASEKAKLGLTAINVGLNCVGPVIPVARSLGRKRALEMLLYGEMLPAQKAYEMGLLNKVVPPECLDEEADWWAVSLARKSPVAVQHAKKSFYASADMDYGKQFQYMNEAFAGLCTTDEAKEGVSAFLEKRDPSWKNN